MTQQEQIDSLVELIVSAGDERDKQELINIVNRIEIRIKEMR